MRKKIRRVAGVGINDADYHVTSYVDGHQLMCPFYNAWNAMIKRCYSRVHQSRSPTYAGCEVCNEWHTFSAFKAWMEKQDWAGKELDKDILVPGNKIYGPEFCVFVDAVTNSFMIDSGASRGNCPVGASFHKKSGRYSGYCNNPFTRKKEHLGLFDTPQEAHAAWRQRKHKLSCDLASQQADFRVASALQQRYL